MQLKTFLALFCTFTLVLIEVNDSAPTTTLKPVTIKLQPAVAKPDPKPVPVAGGRTAWSTKLDPKSKKLFTDHKKIILKKLQQVHKVPSNFNPKPVKSASQMVAGVLHHYLIKLPVNKYAHVTILHQAWKKGEYGKEEHVTVRPQLYALNDKNI